MNVGIGTKAALFPEKESIMEISFAVYSANEGPVTIQYKCLLPIYVFPEMKLHGPIISKTKIMFCLPIFIFPYLWAIYLFSGSVCLFCCSQIGKQILGIYKSLNRYMDVGRVSDPHWFNADPETNLDPTFFLILDPDSGSGSRIRIQGLMT